MCRPIVMEIIIKAMNIDEITQEEHRVNGKKNPEREK